MQNETEKIWNDAQNYLLKEMKGPSFQTWIKPSKLLEITNGKAIIGVKNEFNRNFLKQCYMGKITQALERVTKSKLLVEIIVKPDININEFISSIANLEEKKQVAISHSAEGGGAFGDQPSVISYLDHTFRHRSNLNPSYTFENFVVGPSNQFCHAACLAVAESQNKEYNPFFIYGGVGLGKTHLTHAVANHVHEQKKNAIVTYLSSETFTNELIQSIRNDSMTKFREKYRQIDLLIIDDVQFLAGKEATQEEFFHTFNALKENKKQIILTCDRPPNTLTSIADRLKNRFEGGLIADINVPDLETRIAILMLKAQEQNINLQNDVAEYIAIMFPNNIRELEGALKRVHAYLSFIQEEINLKNVQKVLSSSSNLAIAKPSPEAILKTIASFYHVTYEDLISSKRSSYLTKPRHIAVYILHDFYNLSFPRIGELLSNRTHSSAIYAYKQLKKKLEIDPGFSENINSLRLLIERKPK